MTTFVPNNTITISGVPAPASTGPTTQQGIGPAQDVWPDTAAGGATDATYPPLSWSQATWFIDPANVSGNASDSNSGISALTPVRSYNGGVVARWGTTSPILRQNTTITWMSSQPVGGADPVILTPTIGSKSNDPANGAIMIVQGTTTLASSGTIVSRVAKNRATGQSLTADLGAPLAIGTLIKNTTAGKVSFSMIHALLGGTSYGLTQPIVPVALPMGETPTTTEVDTWAATDTYEAYTLPHVNLVQCTPIAAALNEALSYPAVVQLTNLAVYADDEVNSNGTLTLDNTSMLNCYVDTTITGSYTTGGDLLTNYVGCLLFGSVVTRNEQVGMAGGAIYSPIVGSSLGWNALDFDCIVDVNNSELTVGSPSFTQGEFTTILGLVCVQGVFSVVATPLHINAHSSVSGQNIIWGSGGLNVSAGARLVYRSGAGAAVATFLLAGGLKINNHTDASHYNNTTGVWTANLALTPANLDNAAVFAGFALRPGGGTITNDVAI